mgnify:CR=1 FL=1
MLFCSFAKIRDTPLLAELSLLEASMSTYVISCFQQLANNFSLVSREYVDIIVTTRIDTLGYVSESIRYL